jgi:hypothetical protein
MEKRLEAGWWQRIAWVVLSWGSCGLLMWVPFLYVAIRRGRVSDWGAVAAFALYESVSLPLAMVRGSADDDPFLGLAVIVTMLVAAGLLLFGVFDRPTPKPQGYMGVPVPQQAGNPYLR